MAPPAVGCQQLRQVTVDFGVQSNEPQDLQQPQAGAGQSHNGHLRPEGRQTANA